MTNMSSEYNFDEFNQMTDANDWNTDDSVYSNTTYIDSGYFNLAALSQHYKVYILPSGLSDSIVHDIGLLDLFDIVEGIQEFEFNYDYREESNNDVIISLLSDDEISHDLRPLFYDIILYNDRTDIMNIFKGCQLTSINVNINTDTISKCKMLFSYDDYDNININDDYIDDEDVIGNFEY